MDPELTVDQPAMLAEMEPNQEPVALTAPAEEEIPPEPATEKEGSEALNAPESPWLFDPPDSLELEAECGIADLLAWRQGGECPGFLDGPRASQEMEVHPVPPRVEAG